MTLRQLLREGIAILAEGGIRNADQEATWLMEFALRATRLQLHLNDRMEVDPRDRERVMAIFARRATREPLQYILGAQEFCSLEFLVTPAVLIPRPETELLVKEVARYARCLSNPTIADIGTGSGCIAVALAKALPEGVLYATDLSSSALRVAWHNARRHGVQDRVRFMEGDLLEPIRGRVKGRLSAIVSNPPYVPDGEVSGLPPEVAAFEPRLALAGGPDGLEFHRRLLREAAEFLQPGGLLAMEVGQGQARPVSHVASALGVYGPVRTVRDDAGIERVVWLERRAASV
jgi:release factor glutamine methyltransferase